MSERLFACTAAGSCVVSFMAASLPVLQWLAVLVTIAAGIKALFFSKKGDK